MFNNLKDLSYKRNWKQVIGFYIAYTLLAVALLAAIMLVLILLMKVFSVSESRATAFISKVGFIVSSLYVVALCYLVLAKKKIRIGMKYGILLLALLVLPFIWEGLNPLITLIIPAVLTRKEPVSTVNPTQ